MSISYGDWSPLKIHLSEEIGDILIDICLAPISGDSDDEEDE